MNYIDTLIDNCQKAKKATVVREFIMNDISELDGIKHAIYIIEQVEGDTQKAFDDFSNYKKSTKRNCSKPNKVSSVMYVGSSTTGLRRRISEHLGKGAEKTYALNLKYWFDGTYKITIKEYDVSREVLQIIENNIWHEREPAFGKSGSNNR